MSELWLVVFQSLYCLQVPGGGLPASPKPGTPQSAKRGGLARWRGTEQEGSPLKGAAASQQRNAFTTRCAWGIRARATSMGIRACAASNWEQAACQDDAHGAVHDRPSAMDC